MDDKLNILIVEDSEDDTLLLIRKMKKEGVVFSYIRVETAVEMNRALSEEIWDVILADYSMPHFSAPAALNILKEHKLDIPFILVSGHIGEETAVEAMKAGAHDYIRKGNMSRLIPVIQREIREAKIRQKKREAEEELKIYQEKPIATINRWN